MLNVEKFIDDTLANGGNTYPMPSNGYMVSLTEQNYRNLNTVWLKDWMREWIKNNKRRLNENDHYHIGSWIDGGNLYLEISERFDNLDDALLVGRNRNQIAIYDVVKGESIYLT